MTDRPQTPEEKATRMYNKPAWISKWYIHRKRTQENTDGEVKDRSVASELLVAFGEWLTEKRPLVERYVARRWDSSSVKTGTSNGEREDNDRTTSSDR